MAPASGRSGSCTTSALSTAQACIVEPAATPRSSKRATATSGAESLLRAAGSNPAFPPQSVTKYATGTMCSLPEEILDQIIAHLVPATRLASTRAALETLCNLSLVSKRFHRITEPHLFHTIPAVLNEKGCYLDVFVRLFDSGRYGFRSELASGVVMTERGYNAGRLTFTLPNLDHSNTAALLTLLKARPELKKHVKVLNAERDDMGFAERWQLG